MALFFLLLWLVVLPLAGLALAAYLIYRGAAARGRRVAPGPGAAAREPPPAAGPFAAPFPLRREGEAPGEMEAAGEIAPAVAPGLPESYGEDRLVLLTRDPYWLFAYWELGPALEAEARRRLGPAYAASQPVLRLYDLEVGDHLDSRLTPEASSWYLNPARPGHRFLAELGLLDPSGRFLSLLRSNLAATPPDGPAPSEEGEWACPEELFLRLFPWLRRPRGPGSPLAWGRRGPVRIEAGFSPGLRHSRPWG
ncbi:MAG: DUF4912 domain-containing protein [Acetobacteraceae bacterium]|nr:DUF4912 domain-containing protein [Acetobacteraceae bacterium]